MARAGAIRDHSRSNPGKIAEPIAVRQPVEELDQRDLRSLADFFLLLDEWDNLQSTGIAVEQNPELKVA